MNYTNNFFILPNKKKNNNILSDNQLNILNKTIVRIISNCINFNWRRPYISETYSSVGTGFFINNDGTIITCSHVVDQSYKIQISIPSLSNDKYDASIVGIYPERDIAVLKIKDYKSENYLICGDSDKIKQTDKVIAIGFMLASEQLKITTGYINGFNDNKIQMDAIINSGNSGGPLLNENFEVIGINASKQVGKSIEGVNYAVPIKQFLINKDIMINENNTSLVQMQSKTLHLTPTIVRAPKLGISYSLIQKDYLNFLNIDIKKYDNIGLTINKIIPNSPADKAGLLIDDIILEYNSNKLDKYGMTKINNMIEKVDINYLIYNSSILDKINLKILRKSNNIYIEKIIEIDLSNNNFYKIKYYFPPIETVNYLVLCGLVLMNLTYNHIQLSSNNNLNIYKNKSKRNINKVIITYIINGSNIHTLDIIEKDSIIKSINNHNIETLDDVMVVLFNIKTNKDSYIKILTENNNIIFMEIKDMLKEDKILSIYNGYESKISNLLT
jgi:S1-C subfamily serine protease